MRVVSLVPSLTEAVAVTLPGLLVGATDWCVHPAGLDVVRVGGTKYPDLARVVELRPDVVLVNVEENRRADAEALRDAGVHVYSTYPRTVDAALDELGGMLAFLGAEGEPLWLAAARAAWASLEPVGAGLEPAGAGSEPAGAGLEPAGAAVRSGTEAGGRAAEGRRAVIPVWRRPWVVLGSDTFAGDVLRRLGVGNLYGAHPERYPRPSLEEIRARSPDLVVLPDEPYAFGAADGPEAFPGTPCALVSGRHLTWYGPSLAEAPAVLGEQLGRPVTAR